MAAQKISGERGISTKASDSQVETKPDGEISAAGRPKYMSTMMTSGGNARNRSTTKMINQLRGRMPRLRSRASARPASRPLMTISTASSMVTTTPDRMSGRYFSITLALKKVSTKRSQAVMGRGPPGPHHPLERTWRSALRMRTCSVPLDLADESARALLGRILEDRCRRPLLHDQPIVHEHHAVGGIPGKPHLAAD